jgi:protocatechuate 3,4-dioxygenase beta subunit
MTEKPSVTLPGTVEKIIKPIHPSEPEKAQISVDGADELYQEIRIENTLTDENGEPVRLKKGAQVDVTVEADPDATHPSKKPDDANDSAKSA